MSLPYTRNQTYIPGVTKVAAQDMNDIQDSIVALSGGEGVIVRDHFTGTSLNTGLWRAVSGTSSIVNDSANGGVGTLQTDALGTDIRTIQFNIGTSDFTLRGRLRMTGSVSGGASFGIDGPGANQTLKFVIRSASSTTNWLPWVDSFVVAANGTPALITATYSVFEIKRKANIVTFTVDGVILHTQVSYTGPIYNAYFTMQAGNATIIWFDFAELMLFAF